MNKAKDILEGNKLIAEFMGDITDNGKEWAATETPLKTKNKNHV